jgi:outer membrane PBP1 activator LpoA protein
MSYDRLIREHEAIDALTDALVVLVDGNPAVDDGAALLERLARVIRDHMAVEERTLAATLDAASHDRHHAAAVSAMRDVEELREDWTLYLYRWTPAAIAADWARFGMETRIMMARLHDRVAQETGILYSLALHYRLIAPGR